MAAMDFVSQEFRDNPVIFPSKHDLEKSEFIRPLPPRTQKKIKLHLNFQAQYVCQTRAMIGAEVLLRWSHPELGFVSPGDFIPIAEETGMIGPIGEWIILETCRQCSEWHDMGIAPPRLAMNVSHRQLKLSKLQDIVSNALAAHHM